MGKAVELLRWTGFLPIGFLASLVAGVAGYYLVSLFGGASWYTCLVSGGASGADFIAAAFSIAPRVSTPVKWIGGLFLES